ncbi:replication initiator protein A [Bengtsoniella intestinalis]|uniref:replication initiator protein A n=1 Tax=Bengtsoniella intestinalis TaxID=3073143 RepID=UPI00391F8C1A
MDQSTTDKRPSFSLMTQSDVQNSYYMQLPIWLFSDPRYAEMSTDAKLCYTFLRNRFQLSRKNKWVNKAGEIFVIFPRKALAQELRICEQRVSAAFKKLVEMELIWEKRNGRGMANHIFLAVVHPILDEEYTCAPFTDEEGDSDCDSRNADLEGLDLELPQEQQDMRFKNHQNSGSRTTDLEVPEPQDSFPSKNNFSKTYFSKKDSSQSVPQPPKRGKRTDRQDTDEKELQEILMQCELYTFYEGTAQTFADAIQRLYYTDNYRIGGATMPQKRVREKLRKLNNDILTAVEQKLENHSAIEIKNVTGYLMSVIFNTITEVESDLMLGRFMGGYDVG